MAGYKNKNEPHFMHGKQGAMSGSNGAGDVGGNDETYEKAALDQGVASRRRIRTGGSKSKYVKINGIRRGETGPVSEESREVIEQARTELGHRRRGFRGDRELGLAGREKAQGNQLPTLWVRTKKASSVRKKGRGISTSDDAYDGLLLLAQQFQCMHGAKYSVSRLVELIGLHKLIVIDPSDFSGGLARMSPDS